MHLSIKHYISRYVNPFDILSGKVIRGKNSIRWFKEAGNNADRMWRTAGILHRDDGPAVIGYDFVEWHKNGIKQKQPYDSVFSDLKVGEIFYCRGKIYVKASETTAFKEELKFKPNCKTTRA